MGGPSDDDRSLSSVSSSDGHSRRDDRRHRRRRSRGTKKRHERHSDAAPRSMPAAPSDWDELRAHYQFVLPDANDGGNGDGNDAANDGQNYGSTWQERMVQQYHSHLYKEYVLADLSRALDTGRVGLRWRTEEEVANGGGFRCCGNLKCEGYDKAASHTREEREAYRAAAKRHMGIAVAENGGKEPMGVVLPSSENVKEALESYLQSCARERRKVQQQDEGRRHKHRHKRKRKHRHRSKDRDNYSLKAQERSEQERLSRLPYGTGLHDYEVDFVYAEQGTKKRELVKLRLCLRCAPLLFVSKMKDSKGGGKEEERAPAVKAREAREKAARGHAAVAGADNANGIDGESKAVSNGAIKDEGAGEQAFASRGKSSLERDSGGTSDDSSDGSTYHRRRERRTHRSSRKGRRRSKKKRHRESPSDSGSHSSIGSSYASSLDSNQRNRE